MSRSQLNAYGVKDSANLFRVIGGQRYGHWAIEPSPELVSALRKSGVRFRHLKDAKRGLDDLLVRDADRDIARSVEDALSQPTPRGMR